MKLRPITLLTSTKSSITLWSELTHINNIFKISALAAALSLVGCGGDIVLDASTINNSVDNSDNSSTGTNAVDTNPCALYIKDGVTIQAYIEGDNCRYTSRFVSYSNEIANVGSVALSVTVD